MIMLARGERSAAPRALQANGPRAGAHERSTAGPLLSGIRTPLLVCATAFALLVGLRVHGYSLPVWHAVVDGSPAPEVLAGELRPLRSDDWLVGLPLALAQRAHDPPFPRVNRDVGAGLDLVLSDVPAAHWTALFRPFGWGSFLGDDVGVAWMWWSQLLGAAVAGLLVLQTLTRGRTALALLGAAMLVASPMLAYWAYAPARFVAYAALALAAIAGVLAAGSRAARVAWSAAFAWSACCLGLAIYPPWQLPLAQGVVLLGAALVWERQRQGRPIAPALRALAVAGLFVVAVAALFALDAAPALERMLGTAYPGERSAAGGDLPGWRIFAHTLGAAHFASDWSPTLNIAEGAGFVVLWPLTGAIAFKSLVRDRRDPVAFALLAAIALLAFYATLGLPAWLARAAGLSWVPGERVALVLGLADLALLLRVLALAPAWNDRPAAWLAAAWACVLLVSAVGLRASFPEVGWPALAAAILLQTGIGFAIATRRLLLPALGVLLLAAGSATLAWNPLVRGGSDAVRGSPLARQIAAVDAAAGGGSAWISYGPPYAGNLFRAIGVRAITGVHPLPQLELWEALDPRASQREIYNRYAHVTARSSGRPGVRFRLAAADRVEVIVEPDAPELRQLGVTHVLIVAPRAPEIPGLAHLFSHAWNHAYRIRLEEPAPGPPATSPGSPRRGSAAPPE